MGTCRTAKAGLFVASAIALAFAPICAFAADDDANAQSVQTNLQLQRQQEKDAALIRAQQAQLEQEARELAQTRALVEKQQKELDALKVSFEASEQIRAAGVGAPAASDAPPAPAPPPTTVAQATVPASGDSGVPSTPVGDAPPPPPAATLALPQDVQVLSPKGRFTFDNAFEYQGAASDRLVFSGIQIVSGVELGVLEANQTRNDSGLFLDTFRYGLTNRLEVEATIPWVYRHDSYTLVETANSSLSQTQSLQGYGLGDAEATIRYQITSGANGTPIVIGALRAVSNSGVGPYDVKYDQTGVARTLPTGSGFWSLQPTLTVIYPSDPVVLFGALAYQHSFGYDIGKTFGSGGNAVSVGRVQPGDSISVALGFAFSLNQHFSFSLGYRDNYFLPTSTQFLPTQGLLVGVTEQSLPLQDGVLLFGTSYRINDHATINLNFEFGVTPDAPNDTIVLRVPYMF